MSNSMALDLAPIREAMAGFDESSHIRPNEAIGLDRVYFPNGHRGVLDLKRQLVVGNRGMGKSFWTHALTNSDVRKRIADKYWNKQLEQTKVIIGFNGSDAKIGATPTKDEIRTVYTPTNDTRVIWRAVILRAVQSVCSDSPIPELQNAIANLVANPSFYAEKLTALDRIISNQGENVLIIFDALDRLADDWDSIRKLTKGLLEVVLGLQSFLNIRAKVFMRVDQFADADLFQFPDSSKIRNDAVDLTWRPFDLFGLLLFEIQRSANAGPVLEKLAIGLGVQSELPSFRNTQPDTQKQEQLVTAIAGEFMGSSGKRGRVYSWVPLHLSDAANNCSPRTFLKAWKSAADHVSPPPLLAVDHIGLNEGVRQASSARLRELEEDYPWIPKVLEPLRSQFVPMEKVNLFDFWRNARVIDDILSSSSSGGWLVPIGVVNNHTPEALLLTMTSIAVMEERANGKINVPDIFRVEAGIKRKGGVAVPRKK
jgi:hypothetical protein